LELNTGEQASTTENFLLAVSADMRAFMGDFLNNGELPKTRVEPAFNQWVAGSSPARLIKYLE
jgi:hypothetical protein